jgi:hypothetical protein
MPQLQKMIYLISLMILINLNNGCVKKNYTNEECLNDFKTDKKEGYDDLSRQDKAFFEIGVSLECAKYNNNPKETRKHIAEDFKND